MGRLGRCGGGERLRHSDDRVMRFAILTQYYPPEIGAPQARLSHLAERFTRRGHDVTVLTAMPNYPTGRIHPGYGGLRRSERINGTRIVRTFIYPTQHADFPRRLANYLSFTISSALLGGRGLGRPDFLLVESPPLFLGLVGAWLSRRTGARMIINVSDLWPASVVHLGKLRPGSRAHKLTVRLERYCYRHATLVTGQSNEIVSDIAARYPERETYHLSNGVDIDRFQPARATPEVRAALAPRDRCVAVYAGLHGLAQGLDAVVRVAAALPTNVPLDVIFVGDGPEKRSLQDQARALGTRRVRFLKPRPHAEVPAILAAADIVLVPLGLRLPGAVPSKLYEAMGSGRAVVLVADGEPARIVRTHEAGLVVPPGDGAGLAAALQRLAADPELRARLGANGRTATVQCYDRTRIGDAFVAFLERRLASTRVRALPASTPSLMDPTPSSTAFEAVVDERQDDP